MESTTQNNPSKLEHRQYYPRAAAPVSPVLSCNSFSFKKENSVPTLLELNNILSLTSGRAAIVLALKHAGIKNGDQVLVPAYHCESMVTPIRHVGGTPVFYRIKKNTLVDIDSCQALLNSKTRAIIITHYFGFPQKLDEIKSFCKSHQLVMIEDCAHSLFGSYQGAPIGSFGDYAIASTMKFFPVFDGGILTSSTRNLETIKLETPPLAFQLKSALTTLERAISYNRLGVIGKALHVLTKLKDRLWKLVKHTKGTSGNPPSIPASAEGGFGLDPEWISIKPSKITDFIVKNGSRKRIAKLRRKYYSTYTSKLIEMPGCYPLHPVLNKNIIPLVFAVRFDKSEAIFDILKREAVPIWRFGEFLDPEITEEICPISYDYSKSILQFPCHQEMLEYEINWIIGRIKAACSEIN